MDNNWYPIPGFDNYTINKNGDVFSKASNRLLRPSKAYGYLWIKLSRNNTVKRFSIHRLVMLVFNGDSKLQVNHKDGNKLNNCLDNLEYMTSGQNVKHAHDSGLCKSTKGQNHGMSKLTDEKVIEIKKLLKTGKTHKEIANLFGVGRASVGLISQGKTWKHI